MAYCPNCKSYLSCSCQEATANDGRKACSNCVASLNQQIAKKNVIDPKVAPQNVRTTYKTR